MKLIGSPTSPFVRKVRVVMAEKKLEYEFVIENVWAEDTNIHQYNPLGKVPCLIMDEDNGGLFDSRVIVEYLDTLSPVGRLLPQQGRDRAMTKCWEAAADGILDAVVSIFIENNRRAPQERSPSWIARQEKKITHTLEHLSKNLDEQPFCMGINFSLADVAVGCALGYLDLRLPELDWRSQYPNLARLNDKLQARPSFEVSAPPEN